ncbi:MAG: hypothetical protein V1492_02045 [Candidatus Micrarchaeota archaeon]
MRKQYGKIFAGAGQGEKVARYTRWKDHFGTTISEHLAPALDSKAGKKLVLEAKDAGGNVVATKVIEERKENKKFWIATATALIGATVVASAERIIQATGSFTFGMVVAAVGTTIVVGGFIMSIVTGHRLSRIEEAEKRLRDSETKEQ